MNDTARRDKYEITIRPAVNGWVVTLTLWSQAIVPQGRAEASYVASSTATLKELVGTLVTTEVRTS